MIRFIKSLQFIFYPDFWERNYPTSRKLDIEINRLLDKGVKFTNITSLYADLDWLEGLYIKGYPYTFCHYTPGEDTYMPTRLTCKRVKKVLEQQGVDI